MSTGKRIAATVAVWVGYCYALTCDVGLFERPATLWFWIVVSVSAVATAMIWGIRRRGM